MGNQVLSWAIDANRSVSQLISFNRMMTTTEAERWLDKHISGGFDLVCQRSGDGLHYECLAVKYA